MVDVSILAEPPVAAATSQKVAETAIGVIVVVFLGICLIVAIGAKINDARGALPGNFRSHRGQMISVFTITTFVVGLITAALQANVAIAVGAGFAAGLVLTLLLFS